MTRIYGIKNCGTMKRAFAWLKDNDISYEFHDYKKAGISEKELQLWSDQAGWEKLLNTRGTTWRKLTEDERADMNKQKAFALMQANPSLIKRPVLATDKSVLVGFQPDAYQDLFGK